MVNIKDIHTHHTRKDAVINASSCNFSPQVDYYYSVGIHPWDIKDIDVEKTFDSVTQITQECKQIIAIGECGLDATIETPMNVQMSILEKHITLAESLKKPLILHCVRRTAEILLLHKNFSPKMPWIIHGFRGNCNVLKNVLNAPNIYISIGEKFNADAVRLIPNDRILLETDESDMDIDTICEKVAIVRNTSAQNLAQNISHNICNIFADVIIS